MINKAEVYRIFSEKKPEFAVEADQLLHDIHSDLSIATIDKVRIINRYDISGILPDEYSHARNIVFSEPPLDFTYDEAVDLAEAAYVLAVESLPGQYDQRADSAAQCIQIITKREQPTVRTAKVYAFYGSLTEEQKKKTAEYLINPVEKRAASLSKPDTLADTLSPPEDIEAIDRFCGMSENELIRMQKDMGLAMSLDDLLFTQKYFKSAKEKSDIYGNQSP